MTRRTGRLPETGADGLTRGRRRAAYRVVAAAALAFFPFVSAAAAALEPVTPLLAGADTARGAKFAVRCKACHTLTKGGATLFGPALWNVVGRKKAGVAGFRYTPSFQKLAGVWDYESLNALLADPNAVAPGTRMKLPGMKNVRERADLIRYLRDLGDAPAALPSGPAARPAREAAAPEEDFEGLPAGPGREEVFYLCAACHSLKLVTQQGLPRDRWDELLVWMTERQGMPEIDGKERDLVLDYLARHYGIPAQRPGTMTPMAPPPLMPLPPPAK